MNQIQMKESDQDAQRGLIVAMANQYGLEPKKFFNTLKRVIDPGNKATIEEIAAYLVIVRELQLNPLAGEAWLVPTRNGPRAMISFDGWAKIANSNPDYDGCSKPEFEYDTDGKLLSCTIAIYRKGRTHPHYQTSFLKEWSTDTPVWKSKPHHMLQGRTFAQGVRFAFSVAGVIDQDEVEFFKESGAEVIEPATDAAIDAEFTDSNVVELPQQPETASATGLQNAPAAEPQEPEQPEVIDVDAIKDINKLRQMAADLGMSDTEKKRRNTLVPFLKEKLAAQAQPETPEPDSSPTQEPEEQLQPEQAAEPTSKATSLLDEMTPSTAEAPDDSVPASEDQISDEDIPGGTEFPFGANAGDEPDEPNVEPEQPEPVKKVNSILDELREHADNSQ